MRAVATVLVTWFDTQQGGVIRGELWLSRNDEAPARYPTLTMGGSERVALDVANSLCREARELMARYVPGEADERDTGWSRARRRDGTVRYGRTVSLTGRIG